MKELQTHRKISGIFILAIAGMLLILGNSQLFGQIDDSIDSLFRTADTVFSQSKGETPPEGPPDKGGAPQQPLWGTTWSNALNIILTLLLASVLSALISYRRGGGRAQLDFTEAHIVLSVAAALMMMIIGSQIARAFGLMGAASIVRYRYSLKSPKEASSLVIALGIGMACGVGLYPLAIIVSLYIVALLWIIEHIPGRMKKTLFAPDLTWNLRVRTLEQEETLSIITNFLEDEEVEYRIVNITGGKGPNSDLTEIEVDIFERINRNELSRILTESGAQRIRWKQRKTADFVDLDEES